MYSKTTAMLMLLGFCSGASNLQISSTGTQKIHAGEISVANADRPVAQASTSLTETTIYTLQGVDVITVIHGVVVILALVCQFTTIAIVFRVPEKLQEKDSTENEPVTPSKGYTYGPGATLFYLFLLISSTGFAAGLPSEVTEPRNRIVLCICAGVSGVMFLCWFSYLIVLFKRNPFRFTGHNQVAQMAQMAQRNQ